MLYAFWTNRGTLDQEAMERQVEHVIEAGADGIAVLGLVTESHRMDVAERMALTRAVGAMIAGRLPYSVTVTGETPDAQRRFAEGALAAGADWLVLQPPLQTPMNEDALIAFFGAIAAECDRPLGVQNNPEHLKNALTAEGLLRLHAAVPRITIAKAEGPVVNAEPMIAATAASLASFGGHGGIEHLRLLRAGAHGLIPAPDCLPLQARIQRLWMEGTDAAREEAASIEQALLPLIVFMNRSIDVLLCYGRQFMARRLGIGETFDRFGTLTPTDFGLAEMELLWAGLARAEERFLP